MLAHPHPYPTQDYQHDSSGMFADKCLEAKLRSVNSMSRLANTKFGDLVAVYLIQIKRMRDFLRAITHMAKNTP